MLTSCSDCGRKISVSATSCPGCGAKTYIPPPRDYSPRGQLEELKSIMVVGSRQIGIGILLLLVLFAFMGVSPADIAKALGLR